MKRIRNIIVVLASLVLVGLAKLPYDERLEADMLERGLLPEPIELDTREKLGQTSVAIALGGLRSVIASMMNIGAHVHWENQEWFELEQDYRTIVTLQPKTRYYWTVAGWHLYSNAYADYESKPGITEGLRKRQQQEFFEKGISFLDGGLAANPNDWRMWAEKGNALSQWWRPRDLDKAAEAYRNAFALSGNLQIQRNHVYVLSRIRGREKEAWEAAREMWAEPRNRRFPSPRTIFYALQHWAQPPARETVSVEEIYQSPYTAARDVPDYWFRQKEGYPMYGIPELLQRLSESFQIPESIRPLRFEPNRSFSYHPLTGEPFVNPATGELRERDWASLWMDEIRHHYQRILRLRSILDRLRSDALASLSPEERFRTRLLAARDLPSYWLRPREGYPLDQVAEHLAELNQQFQVPETLRPMRYERDRELSDHPLTGDPLRGEAKRWSDVWMEEVRPAYEDHLKQLLEGNP